MGNVYGSDIGQLEKELTQIYVINILWTEHYAHSPHKAARSSTLQQANTDAFELKKTAVLCRQILQGKPKCNLLIWMKQELLLRAQSSVPPHGHPSLCHRGVWTGSSIPACHLFQVHSSHLQSFTARSTCTHTQTGRFVAPLHWFYFWSFTVNDSFLMKGNDRKERASGQLLCLKI